MKIAVLGTGMVGNTIGSKLVALGHEVRQGSRSADNEKGKAWLAQIGSERASLGDYASAAGFGELIINCTAGGGSIEALTAAGERNLEGKVLIDIANPLDFSKGMPPQLSIFNDDSLGERIQRTFPGAKVVKTLNTVNCNVMVDPSRLPGEHAMFMSGNDAQAKAQVRGILTEWLGWKQVLDLGDISTARGTESYLPLWIRLWGALKTPDFNIAIVKAT
ncbi:NADPH-dependent F420 reductase [Nannocystaceae bacterium ST9]